MSDRAVVALALAVCAGAWLAPPVPRTPAVALAIAALLLRRPATLVVAAGLVAASLSAFAWAGLAPPAPRSVAGTAVLAGDPVDRGGALRVELRLDGRRVEAWARGAPAAALRPRLAGEVVEITGRLRPPSPSARAWLASRHIAARLEVEQVGDWHSGSAATRIANGLRRTLERGARSLDDDQRSLLLGVSIGDDRDQPDALADDFRASGLTHLLAVSGQNVAFLLVLASSLLSRLSLGGRWLVTLALLAFFGLLTRWEPSVLRAASMAAVACTSSTLGRPSSRLRLLSLAVAGVVLLDPLLVHAVGFQLSVGATLGITLLARPLAERLPGPSWLAEPLAVTVAAQAGVAPIAVPLFGGLPVASLPANLLAVPVAAPLSLWGLTGGLLAGLLGRPFDSWLHQPTRLMTGWLGGVAGWAAALPLGQLHVVHVVVAAGAVVVAMVAPGRLVRGAAAVVACVAALVPAVRLGAGDLVEMELARGATAWRAEGAVVVVDDGAAPLRLLEGLRRQSIRRIDLYVAANGKLPDPLVGRRVHVRAVLGTERSVTARAGPLVVDVGDDGVTVRRSSS